MRTLQQIRYSPKSLSAISVTQNARSIPYIHKPPAQGVFERLRVVYQ
jgi:hypothetical protein